MQLLDVSPSYHLSLSLRHTFFRVSWRFLLGYPENRSAEGKPTPNRPSPPPRSPLPRTVPDARVLAKVSRTTCTCCLSHRSSASLPQRTAALSGLNLICAADGLADSRGISHRAFHRPRVAGRKRQKSVIYCVAGAAAAPTRPELEPGPYCISRCTDAEQIVWLQRA